MSEKNMDDLLAQLKTEFEPRRESKQKITKPAPRQPVQSPQSNQSSASMERMLDELRTELESGRGRPNSQPDKREKSSTSSNKKNIQKLEQEKNSSKYRQRLNDLIDRDYQIQAGKREAKLAELERQEKQRIAAEKRRQQEIIEAQQREELREKRRKEALKVKAQQWLKNLNLRSEEGKWFEEFSYSYENKLEAAIDYLEAMRESGL